MNQIENCTTDKLRAVTANGAPGSGKIAMTVKEATAVSGLGKTTLYELMRTGALPRIKVGSRTLIRQDDLERILQSVTYVAGSMPVSTH